MNNQEFFLACKYGNDTLVEQLINDGIDINLQNKYGQTALLLALEEEQLSLAEMLINKGANVNIATNDGITALMLAAYCGKLEIITNLINKGADVDVIDKHRDSSLSWAALGGSQSTIKYLIKKSAHIDGVDENGETILLREARFCHTYIVDIFIENGADTNAKDQYGFTVLDRSLGDKSYISSKLLTPNYLNAQDENGKTSLMRACEGKNEDNIIFLYEKGADFNIKSNNGDTALDILINHDELSDTLKAFTEKLLLQYSIDADQTGSPGL